jgi:cytochrome c-type biogenesis protein
MIELIQHSLQGGSFLHIAGVMLLIYLGGVATSFTPCIFPMIPITFAILGKGAEEGEDKSRLTKRVLAYGFGVAMSFVSLGVVAVLSRSMFGAITQHILFKIFAANLFIFIGLSTLGVVSLPQINFGKKNYQSFWGLFFVGLTAGLSLSPCTIPILAVVLGFAAQTSLIVGSLMMWMYAWGFMTLILLLTLFGRKALDRVLTNKRYMHVMDKILALLCFGVAEWLLLMAG